MSTSRQREQGYTLFELLIVIAILIVLAVMAFTAYQRANNGKVLDTESLRVLSEINQARSLAVAAKNADTWGVHVASSTVTLFEGSTYSAGATSNVVTTFDSRVQISAYSLAGGGANIVFSRLTGQTSQNGTITLSLVSTSTVSHTITVYQTGIAELQ